MRHPNVVETSSSPLRYKRLTTWGPPSPSSLLLYNLEAFFQRSPFGHHLSANTHRVQVFHAPSTDAAAACMFSPTDCPCIASIKKSYAHSHFSTLSPTHNDKSNDHAPPFPTSSPSISCYLSGVARVPKRTHQTAGSQEGLDPTYESILLRISLESLVGSRARIKPREVK